MSKFIVLIVVASPVKFKLPSILTVPLTVKPVSIPTVVIADCVAPVTVAALPVVS